MTAAANNSFRPNLEMLEDRLVPTVSYHHGAVLPHVQAENLYVGSEWMTSSGAQTASYLQGFTNYLVQSPYMDALTRADYGVSRGMSYIGERLGFNLGSVVTDGQIQYAIQWAISTQHAAQPNPNSLYVVFIEPHVAVEASNGQTSSSGAFSGYHSYFVGRDVHGYQHYIPYAVIPYPGNGANPQPQLYGYKNEAAEMTDTASHEIGEAVTDPFDSGWYDNRWGMAGEIGDVTESFHQYLGGYYVQLLANQYDQPMPVSNGYEYCIGSSGALVSSNLGRTWSRTNTPYDHPAPADETTLLTPSPANQPSQPFDALTTPRWIR